MNTEVEVEPDKDARFRWLDAVHRCSHLSYMTKCIGWAVFSYANPKSLACWPNLATMDRDLGGQGSSKNVAPHIKALERAGFLKVTKEPHGGHLSNRYTLIEQGKPWECADLHPDLQKADLYPKPPSRIKKTADLDLGNADLEDQGITLSRTHSLTLSKNTLTNTFNEPQAHSFSSEVVSSKTEGDYLLDQLNPLDQPSGRIAAKSLPTALKYRNEKEDPWWKSFRTKKASMETLGLSEEF